MSEILIMNLFLAGSGLVLACLGVCYKSKCKKISLFCGLIEINRDIISELEEDMHGLEMPSTTIDLKPHKENHDNHDEISERFRQVINSHEQNFSAPH